MTAVSLSAAETRTLICLSFGRDVSAVPAIEMKKKGLQCRFPRGNDKPELPESLLQVCGC